MRLFDNNHHNHYLRFYNYKYFKVNCKVKKSLKNRKIFIVVFQFEYPPYQLFFRKISVAVLTPLLNSSKRSIARGDTGGREVYLNILVMNINDLQEF